MAKRFSNHLSPARWAKGLAIYGSVRLWQEVSDQAGRSRWAEVGAAVAFLWLLGLLGLSFVLLHLNQSQPLPLAILLPARKLQTILAIGEPTGSTSSLSWWGLAIAGLGAWLCLVAGTQKLVLLVAAIYGSNIAQVSDWRTRLLPWGMTILGLSLTSLVFIVLGQNSGTTGPALAQWLGRLGRLALALSVVGLGLGLAYRLIPRRWAPGQPLWPGARLAVALGLGGLGLRQWGLSIVISPDLSYALLLVWGVNLLTLYGLILLVPMGAQINLSTLRHRGLPSRSWGATAAVPPPPSFDSFKIKRRD